LEKRKMLKKKTINKVSFLIGNSFIVFSKKNKGLVAIFITFVLLFLNPIS